MNIFLPFEKIVNPYLDEIQQYSENSFIYGNFNDYKNSFEIVNIHWPEALFGWLEPTQKQLDELETTIKKWKINSKIIYTKHDVTRHIGMTPNFKSLFEIIENNTDVFIHLGDYSKKKYEKKFPNAQHKIVFHPLYESSFVRYSKEIARDQLNIDQDAFVMIIPGTIRNKKEKKLLLRAFKHMKIGKKVLIVTNMRSDINLNFPGRIRLKKFFNIKGFLMDRFKKKYKEPKYIFNYGIMPEKELALKMSASDLVLVPRINILNSGNIFLGFTYRKIVVGPDTGNIGEPLKALNLPLFNPESNPSILDALKKGIEMAKSGIKLNEKILLKYHPKKVAKQMDGIIWTAKNEDF